MKKFLIFNSIFFLILITSLIKNSTKDIDDEIYSLKENLIFLNKRFEDSKLEHEYLSSSKRLLEYQKLYFQNFSEKKILKEIGTIDIMGNKLIIGDLSIVGKNEQ